MSFSKVKLNNTLKKRAKQRNQLAKMTDAVVNAFKKHPETGEIRKIPLNQHRSPAFVTPTFADLSWG